MNHSERSSVGQISDPELSAKTVGCVMQGVSQESFQVPYHKDLHALHELHIDGKMTDVELRNKLDVFFSDKGSQLRTYQTKLAKQCEVWASNDPIEHGEVDGQQQAEQLMQFFADPSGFTVLHKLIEDNLVHMQPDEQLKWLDQTDETLNKMRSLLTTLRYVALHHAEADKHADVHQIFDRHHERLTAVHAHVRSHVRRLSGDQMYYNSDQIGQRMRDSVAGDRIAVSTQAPGASHVTLVHAQHTQDGATRAAHEQVFGRLMKQMHATTDAVVLRKTISG